MYGIYILCEVCIYIYTYAYTVAATVAAETRTGSHSQKTLIGQDRSSWRWLDPFLQAAFCGFCSLFWSWPIDFLASNFHRLGNMLGQILGDILPHHRERTASIPVPGCWLVLQLPFSFSGGYSFGWFWTGLENLKCFQTFFNPISTPNPEIGENHDRGGEYQSIHLECRQDESRSGRGDRCARHDVYLRFRMSGEWKTRVCWKGIRHVYSLHITNIIYIYIYKIR